MSMEHKYDFAVIISVDNANPNGDPSNGNRPRTDLNDHGEITDVCIKRKIRDRLQEAGEKIYVQSKDKADDGCASLQDRAKDVLKEKDEAKKINLACEKWFDVRAFGQLFAFKKGEDSAKGHSIGIRGPVTIRTAVSVDAINVTSTQITKSVNSITSKDDTKTSDTMGTKHRVDKGIYVCYGAMNPQLAEKTGFTDADAEKILAVLPKLFENDASSARPEGSMAVRKVIVWRQPGKTGKYSSAKLHSSLTVQSDGSYQIQALEGITPKEIDGF